MAKNNMNMHGKHPLGNRRPTHPMGETAMKHPLAKGGSTKKTSGPFVQSPAATPVQPPMMNQPPMDPSEC